MEQLVINNIDKNLTLGNILKQYGVKFKEFEKYWVMLETEYIDGGLYGKAFNIGNDKVLKVTKDIDEFKAMSELIHMINTLDESDLYFKHYVSIPLIICPVNENFYEYSEDDSFNSNTKYIRYYYIMEKLYNLNNSEREIFLEIFNYYHVDGIDEIYYDEYDDFFNDIIENTDIYNLYENKLCDGIIHFITNCIELNNEYNFYDMNINNILKDKNGNYKLIDLRKI